LPKGFSFDISSTASLQVMNSFLFFFFLAVWGLNSGLVLAKQALSYLSHASSFQLLYD
jgi:hypothetical protein